MYYPPCRYYEVHVDYSLTSSHGFVARSGWALNGTRSDAADGTGVGDDMFSWSFDGAYIRFAGKCIAVPRGRPLAPGASLLCRKGCLK